MTHDPELLTALADCRAEVLRLNVEVLRLKGRAIEDRHIAEKRIELEVGHAKNADTDALEKQIVELQQTIAEEGAIIDRIVVYLTKESRCAP